MIEYRAAEKEHIPQILGLYKQLIPEEDPVETVKAEKIWEEIERYNVKYFIALENGEVISSCYIAVIPNLSRGGKSNGFIENVITRKDYRRRGIGKKLLDMAINYAEENNCYKIFLLSGMERKESHIFYEKCGFDTNSKKAFVKRLC